MGYNPPPTSVDGTTLREVAGVVSIQPGAIISRGSQRCEIPFSAGASRYLPLGGGDQAGETANTKVRGPRASAGTVSGLRFRVGVNNMGVGDSMTITLQKNGIDTALSATVASTDLAGSTVLGAGGSVAYVAEDDLCWKITTADADEAFGLITWQEVNT